MEPVSCRIIPTFFENRVIDLNHDVFSLILSNLSRYDLPQCVAVNRSWKKETLRFVKNLEFLRMREIIDFLIQHLNPLNYSDKIHSFELFLKHGRIHLKEPCRFGEITAKLEEFVKDTLSDIPRVELDRITPPIGFKEKNHFKLDLNALKIDILVNKTSKPSQDELNWFLNIYFMAKKFDNVQPLILLLEGDTTSTTKILQQHVDRQLVKRIYDLIKLKYFNLAEQSLTKIKSSYWCDEKKKSLGKAWLRAGNRDKALEIEASIQNKDMKKKLTQALNSN